MSPEPENPATLLLTYDEAARLLRVCKRTIERMVKARKLPVIQVGRLPRISRVALTTWIERNSAVVGPEHDHGQRNF